MSFTINSLGHKISQNYLHVVYIKSIKEFRSPQELVQNACIIYGNTGQSYTPVLTLSFIYLSGIFQVFCCGSLVPLFDVSFGHVSPYVRIYRLFVSGLGT